MPKKKAKRRAWSNEDVREFKSLAKAKTPAKKIASRFKRTRVAEFPREEAEIVNSVRFRL
jgi:hypothetical protein